MGRLSSADIAGTRAITDLLARLPIDESSSRTLDHVVDELRALTGARAATLYSLEPHEEGLRLAQASAVGVVSWRSTLDEFLADKTVGWSAFNPLAPEPSQRNRVLEWLPAKLPRSPVERDVYPRIGLAGFGTTRALVCEGSQLLAYVALFDPAPADQRARQILRRLLDPIRKRMFVEHLLRVSAPLASALQAVLEEVGVAASVVGANGHVLFANGMARSKLARDGRQFRNRLAAATRAANPPAALRVVPLDGRGLPTAFLVLDREGPDLVGERVNRSAQALRLSDRQLEVAVLLASGLTNRAIALRLGIAERTVESHVTALFERASVASRSALVAKLLG